MSGTPRRRTAQWVARDRLKERAPGLLRAYRRYVAPIVSRDVPAVRMAKWAAEGERLRAQLGVPAYSFEESGVWVTDPEGLQWKYLPGVFLSAVGRELGLPHDEAELAHVKEVVGAGGALVDIGGHAGGYSIPVALAVPGAEIHAFEPVPASRALFEANAARNGATDRINLWPNAVSDRAGTMAMTAGNSMENHLVPGGEAGADEVAVEVITLDEHILPRVERVAVIKIDVEGAELPALRGGDALLRRDHPDLIVEVDERLTGRFGYTPADLVDHLAGLGYRWERFVGGRRLPATDLATALGEGNNFLFTAAPDSTT